MGRPLYTVSDADRQRYEAQGFAALGPIMSDEDTRQLRAVFDKLFAKPADGGKPLYYDLTGDDPDAEIDNSKAVPQLLHPSHHVPELKQTAAWQAALDIAMQLLDVGEHTRDDLIVRDHAIVKPPGSTGATPWHQDEAYWEDDLHYNELSVWIALQDTTREGCMQFIPGSHKGEIIPHHPWKNDPKIVALEVDDGHVDESQAVPAELKAGGASLHHCRTLHYTSGNVSSEPRRAFILTVGTPPTKLDKPRDFYWNRKQHSFKDHIAPAK
jgi:hypothetical protein